MVVVIFHFTTNDVCIVLLIWRSKHGWFDEGEACTKKLRRRWRHGPNTTISQNGGGVGGGAGGCRIQGPGPAAPPPVITTRRRDRRDMVIALRRAYPRVADKGGYITAYTIDAKGCGNVLCYHCTLSATPLRREWISTKAGKLRCNTAGAQCNVLGSLCSTGGDANLCSHLGGSAGRRGRPHSVPRPGDALP